MKFPQPSINILLITQHERAAATLKQRLVGDPDLAVELLRARGLQEAVGCLAESRVDLVLLDLALPEMTRLEGFRLLQKKAADLPILLLVGGDQQELLSTLLAEGAQEGIGGWPEPEATYRAIREVIQRARGEEMAGLFQRALDALPARMAILDETGRLVAMNRAWEQFDRASPFLGAGAQIGTNYIELCTREADSDAPVEGIRAVIAGEQPRYTLEYSSLHRRWYRMEVAPLPGEGPRQVVVAHDDISERKWAEEALRSSEEHYRTIVELTRDGIWIVDEEERTTYINDRMADILGYEPGDILGRPLFDFISPKSWEAVARSVPRRRQGVREEYEVILRRSDGSELMTVVSANPLYDAQGRFRGSLGIFTDITEHLQIKVALEESSREMAQLLERITDGFFALDREWRLTYLNPEAERLLQRPREELLGKNIWEEFPEAVGTPFYDQYHQAVEQQVATTFEVLYPPLDVWFEVHAYPAEEGLSVYFRDVSERRQAEEALHEADRRVLENYRELLDRITVLAQEMGMAQELTRVCRALLDFLLSTVPCDGLFVSLYDAEEELRVPIYSWVSGQEEDVSAFPPLPLNDYPQSRAIRTGELVVTKDRLDSRLAQVPHNGLGFQIDSRFPRSSVAVPLRLLGRVIGAFEVQSTTPGAYMAEHISAMQMAANLTAIATENIQLLERERELRVAAEESEGRFRGLVQNSMDIIKILRPDGTIIYESPSVERVLGYHADEVIGRNVFEFVHPDDVERVRELFFNQVLKLPQEPVNMELRFLHKNGMWRMLETTVSNLLDHPSIQGIVANSRDITQRKQHEREVEAIASTAAALRSVQRRDQMLPIILEQVRELLRARVASFVTREPSGDGIVIELSVGAWAPLSGQLLPPGKNMSEKVLATGEPYVNNDPESESALYRTADPKIAAVACIPLMAEMQTIGALWIGRERPIREEHLRLLAAIGDIAANAIHRATLHEQTTQRLQRLAALYAIDTAISSSLDLDVTLDVFLDQVTSQLRVDAVSLLLLSSDSKTLEFAAGRGFRGDALTREPLQLGESYAGRAALERRLVEVPDLMEATDHPRQAEFRVAVESEGFVSYYALPLIAKGQVVGVLELFHCERLQPDEEWLSFLQAVAAQAAIAIDNAALYENLQQSNSHLRMAYDATIEGWSRALDLRDKETEGHSVRVTEMALDLARALDMSEEDLLHMRWGALLHDIGKVGVPDHILLKPGPLTDEEWEIMRRHPIYAYELLSPIKFLRPILDIPYAHHEKWEGSGYPRGLKGEEIPLPARIFAVVDVWDALRSDRPYRKGWPEEKVRDFLRGQAGKHFDPRIVEVFLQILKAQGNGSG